MQIVMLIIYKSHGRDSMGELLHDPDRARAYLATLIRRQVIDMWRRDRNRMVPTSPEQLTLYQDLYGEAAVSAADIANTRDLRDRVRQLPYRQREVLLRVVAGLTLPEIAEDLNLSLPAVRSILKRSRENVRSLIDTLDAETEQDMETELIAEDVLGQQNSAEFWKVLDRDLTHTEFRVAYLSWYSNQSPLEIAKTLGMTVRAVRRYQMNARRKITGMVDRHELALAD
ncbi:hypothetical protein Ntsu_81660 [Nocardia sp. IFM 10818]